MLIICNDLPKGRTKRILEFIEHIEKPLKRDLIKLRSEGLNPVFCPLIKTKEEVLYGSLLFLDVVRESQEIVELAQKAMLRNIRIDPPKWHDVGITCSTLNFYAAINLAEICKGQINPFVKSLLRKLL